MGLIVGVFKNPYGDCTSGGISSRYKELTVVNIDGPFHPAENRPPVALVDGPLGTKRIVPVLGNEDEGYQQVAPEGFVGPMMGGNYAATSDSRFGQAVGFYGAVAIHDRLETREHYASYD